MESKCGCCGRVTIGSEVLHLILVAGVWKGHSILRPLTQPHSWTYYPTSTSPLQPMEPPAGLIDLGGLTRLYDYAMTLSRLGPP